MAMTQEQESHALVQRWQRTFSEHKDDIRGEYDPALDTYYLMIGEPRPAGTIELSDVLLRIDLETGDLVGFEVPHARRFLAKQHPAGENMHVRHQDPQHNLWRHTLQRAEEALIAPASSALGALAWHT